MSWKLRVDPAGPRVSLILDLALAIPSCRTAHYLFSYFIFALGISYLTWILY